MEDINSVEQLQEKKYIFGIDLGTTYSSISYLDENLLIHTCKNHFSADITPSVVDLSNDVNPLVGQNAKTNKVFHPHNVKDFFKRYMGKVDNEITYGEYNDKTTTPIKLSAEVLKHLAQYAKDETGSEVDIAVITVPAYFATIEKEATKKAAELAGFKYVKLIEEPTAAAVYYGYKGDKKETVLVYDLGGGTFDIVAVEIDGINFNCFVVDGDEQLGGKDWDQEMINIIYQKLEENGIDVNDLDEDDIGDIENAAEDAKKQLTDEDKCKIKLKLSAGKSLVEVTREEFDEKTKINLDRTIEKTKKVWEEAKAKGKNITKILLVGGSSRMPQVQERLKQEFPDIDVPNPSEPEMAVSKGAAYYAKAILAEIIKWKNDDIKIENITDIAPGFELGSVTNTYSTIGDVEIGAPILTKVSSYSIGLKGRDRATGKLVYQTLIKRGEGIPNSYENNFPLNDDVISKGIMDLTVVQHRSTDIIVDAGDNSAKIVKLEAKEVKLGEGLQKGAAVHIKFEIDAEGILNLMASDPETGKEYGVLKTQAEIKDSE